MHTPTDDKEPLIKYEVFFCRRVFKFLALLHHTRSRTFDVYVGMLRNCSWQFFPTWSVRTTPFNCINPLYLSFFFFFFFFFFFNAVFLYFFLGDSFCCELTVACKRVLVVSVGKHIEAILLDTCIVCVCVRVYEKEWNKIDSHSCPSETILAAIGISWLKWMEGNDMQGQRKILLIAIIYSQMQQQPKCKKRFMRSPAIWDLQKEGRGGTESGQLQRHKKMFIEWIETCCSWFMVGCRLIGMFRLWFSYQMNLISASTPRSKRSTAEIWFSRLT